MEQKKIAAEKAVEYIKDGMTVGLGTGTTAFYMIKKVGELVKSGLSIKAVSTSKETDLLAGSLDIPLVDIDSMDAIDLAIDGVDKIDRRFNAIKGGGGALFREKIVASLAKEVIWIMDESKLVNDITEYPIPVEVLPTGYTHVLKQLVKCGFRTKLRLKDGEKFLTDNGNYIVDVQTDGAMDIVEVKATLDGIVGVLETGLFLNMCTRIIVGNNEDAVIYVNELHPAYKGKEKKMSIRSTAKAIILNDGKILLNKCRDSKNGAYYSLPGGGQNTYETLRDAVVRESLEETGYSVTPIRFAALCEVICDSEEFREQYPEYAHKMYHIFVCALLNDIVVPPTETDAMQIGTEWCDIDRLAGIRLLPRMVGENIMKIMSSESPIFLGSEHIPFNHG